jgi:predicted nucleic acid-binding protein
VKHPQFIDTNIFLRYLTQDDKQKHRACFLLFQKAEQNEASLTTSESVLAEVVFVLSSKKHYRVSRQQIQIALSRLLILPGLRVRHHTTYIKALGWYAASTLDFEDCLTMAHMQREGLKILYSYDRDFDQFTGVKRIEPAK